LQYGEKKYSDGVYNGYIKDGLREGPGITILTSGQKDIAEYHLEKLHGCGKLEFASGNSYWGECKDNDREGYGTFEYANGD
jgi:MORN repeat